MDEQAALAELTQSQETPAENPTPAETAYFELMNEGKSLRLPLNTELVINENGQVQRVPASKMINNHRQVAHLQREQKKFKDERSAWEKENQGYQELSKHYRNIDDWARTNPDSWSRLQKMFDEKELLLNGNQQNPQNDVYSHLNKTIQSLQERLDKYENMYKESENQKVLSEVETEITQFKKDFPQINLDEQDEDGVSLKGQILHFGAQKAYPTFEAAALAFKYPDGTPLRTKLLDTVRSEGRNAAVKGVKQDHKNGVLARSDKPFTGQNPIDIRRLSSSDRDEMALNELTALLKNG